MYRPDQSRAGSQASRRHPRALLGGVCASAADATGIPLLLVRVAMVAAGMVFCWKAAIAYVLASIALQTRLRRLLPPPPAGIAPPANPMPSPPFADMERRLARLEAAVMLDELRLRSSFRDLERS